MPDRERPKTPIKSLQEVEAGLKMCSSQFEIYGYITSIFAAESDEDYGREVLKLAIERFLEINPRFTQSFALEVLNQIRYFTLETKQ